MREPEIGDVVEIRDVDTGEIVEVEVEDVGVNDGKPGAPGIIFFTLPPAAEYDGEGRAKWAYFDQVLEVK